MFQVWKTINNELSGKSLDEVMLFAKTGIATLEAAGKLNRCAQELLLNEFLGYSWRNCTHLPKEIELVITTPRDLGILEHCHQDMLMEPVQNAGLEFCEPAIALMIALQGGTGIESKVALGDRTSYWVNFGGWYMGYGSMYIEGDKLIGEGDSFNQDTRLIYMKA